MSYDLMGDGGIVKKPPQAIFFSSVCVIRLATGFSHQKLVWACCSGFIKVPVTWGSYNPWWVRRRSSPQENPVTTVSSVSRCPSIGNIVMPASGWPSKVAEEQLWAKVLVDEGRMTLNFWPFHLPSTGIISVHCHAQVYVVLGIEPRALCMLERQMLYHLNKVSLRELSPIPLAKGEHSEVLALMSIQNHEL